MTTQFVDFQEHADIALETIEQCLMSAEWAMERSDDTSLHCAAPTRWGECGGMFVWRDTPPSVHFTLSADLRAPNAKRAAILELVSLINERLWLGHFEYWASEGVIMFRHCLPLLGRSSPDQGEVTALITAATEAIERFLPAFNFVVWAGKTPVEAVEAALFDTLGEA